MKLLITGVTSATAAILGVHRLDALKETEDEGGSRQAVRRAGQRANASGKSDRSTSETRP